MERFHPFVANRTIRFIFILLLLPLFWNCGSEENVPDFGVEALCDRLVDCCHSVDAEFCEPEGDSPQLKKLCAISLQASVDDMVNAVPEVCDEWYGYQAEFTRCLGKEEYLCDELMGEDFETDYADICTGECKQLVEYKEDYLVDECGAVIAVDVNSEICNLIL